MNLEQHKETIIDLALQGIRPKAIAQELSLPERRVNQIVQTARQKGIPIRRWRFQYNKWGTSYREVPIPESICKHFLEIAQERNVEGTHLIRAVLQAVCDDDLFDAVLGPY